MALFKFGKKKEEKAACCCNNSRGVKAQEKAAAGAETVKVLGAGCESCHKQYENVKKAVENLNLAVEVEYITDMHKVMEYGVMSMPVIVVNDKIAAMGKVLKVKEVENLLSNGSRL